ncbi:MAG: type II toxin-antitoxin system HicA family toxin [Candidatus Solibacter usitatus]|nr:type II toxin-antitoxin system HicA family toxin [Candidatus Solibacter usitatus]
MKLPRDISGAHAIKALQRLGFSITRQAGSHVRLEKADRSITVPMHRSIAPGTLQSILRQSGVSIEQFLEAL